MCARTYDPAEYVKRGEGEGAYSQARAILQELNDTRDIVAIDDASIALKGPVWVEFGPFHFMLRNWRV
jgi:hypothetical protein